MNNQYMYTQYIVSYNIISLAIQLGIVYYLLEICVLDLYFLLITKFKKKRGHASVVYSLRLSVLIPIYPKKAKFMANIVNCTVPARILCLILHKLKP